MTFRGSGVGPAAWVLVAASGVTLVEFPLYFGDVVGSTPLGLVLLFLRNGLLVAATLMAADRLWEVTVGSADVPEREAEGPAGEAEPPRESVRTG